MSDSAKKYTIAVIPGDGIGKEVTPWAQKALEKRPKRRRIRLREFRSWRRTLPA